jgi:transcription elongation factor Elf1
MQDGQTKIVEIGVECPKCGQESKVQVATGLEVETQRKSITCAYCKNPWIEFLPGELVSGPSVIPSSRV